MICRESRAGRRFSCAALLLIASIAPARMLAAPGADLIREIRASTLDPNECYRVRDLNLVQEDVKLYFNEGFLIFSKPVNGERVSAVFSAEVDGGDGETVLLPPYRSERQSLARFTNSPNMDEHFRAALLVFTGGPGENLLDRIKRDNQGRKAPEMGPLLAEEWSPVMTQVLSSFELRLVQDLLTPAQSRVPLLFAGLLGKNLGGFDVIYDGRAREQVLAGRLSQRAGRPAYDIWASFAARSSRSSAGRRADEPLFSVQRYKVDAALDADVRLKASIRAQVKTGSAGVRVMPFEISHALRVTAARIDGAPAELLFVDSDRGRAVRDGDNDPFLVIAPGVLAADSVHEVEFEQEGAVIAPAGDDVYFVAARANWYPQSSRGFAIFDLTFKYPKRLTLVSAGDVTEDRTEGDWRVTRRVTPVPIRLAGFNLGNYRKIEAATPGFHVEVYGNLALESALQPRQQAPRNPVPTGRGAAVPPRLPPAQLPPDPAARLRTVAADVSSALQFYSGLFAGPPSLKSLTVSPIPGNFGQGFPGLIYLSTLAYLNPAERPPGLQGQIAQVFYSDLIEAHEVAHQWWGGLVLPDGYQDEWMAESLASYSALLYLEKKKGAKAMEDVLQDYRDHLTEKTSGSTLESAGPVTWGYRLESSSAPDAWRAITYDKGAWIFHMLRRRMGDEAFFKMLAELRRRFESRPVSTPDLRALAKEMAPAGLKPSSIDTFFDNWVYATGIPTLKLTYSIKGTAAPLRITGEVEQSGVDDDFSIEAPVEIQFAKGPPQTIWVSTTTGSTSFSATLRQLPTRVSIPAGTSVLALK